MKKGINQNLENESDFKELIRLKESEERFRKTFEKAAVGIAHVGVEGNFIQINQIFCDIVGYSQQEMLRLTFQELTHPDDLEPDLKNVQRLLDQDIETYSIEKRYIRKDKSTVWINLSVSLVRKESGKPLYFIAVVEDISKRKQAEDRFQLLVNQAGDAFFILDSEGGLSDVNEQACQSTGYSRKELLKMNISEVDIEVEKSEHKIRYWKSLQQGQYITFEGTHRRKNGSVFPVEVRLGRLDLKENILYLALVRDITERKQVEQTLKRNAEFEHLVSRISMKFIGLSDLDFDQNIQNALEEIGKYFGVDTVRLYKLSLKGDVIKIRNAWRNAQLAPPNEMPEIHKLKYPNLASHYSKGKSVVFGNYNESPQWPEMRKILKFFGTRAGVGVPLEVDNYGVDIFAMDKVQSDHIWSNDIVEKSQSIGMVMLSALRRREAELKLHESFSEIERLKEKLEQENIYLQKEIKQQQNFDTIIGHSTSLKYVLYRVEQVAPTNATVLIEGETGTGKELFANALHKASLLKDKPFIKVNCAALSPTLIESEIFGHEKGAFTGANEKRIGRFELAHGGTIFLDEIGELTTELQVKLLRVLQEGEIERLGSSTTIKTDVRVIAATNRNLEEALKQGHFREDLYYRLKVFVITVPPLRDRLEDISLLVRFFVDKYRKLHKREINTIPLATMRKLERHSWPGNVRELENVIENAVIISDKGILRVETPGHKSLQRGSDQNLDSIEKDHIIQVLESANWRIGGEGGAAEILGLKRTTLQSKMTKLGIERP